MPGGFHCIQRLVLEVFKDSIAQGQGTVYKVESHKIYKVRDRKDKIVEGRDQCAIVSETAGVER